MLILVLFLMLITSLVNMLVVRLDSRCRRIPGRRITEHDLRIFNNPYPPRPTKVTLLSGSPLRPLDLSSHRGDVNAIRRSTHRSASRARFLPVTPGLQRPDRGKSCCQHPNIGLRSLQRSRCGVDEQTTVPWLCYTSHRPRRSGPKSFSSYSTVPRPLSSTSSWDSQVVHPSPEE